MTATLYLVNREQCPAQAMSAACRIMIAVNCTTVSSIDCTENLFVCVLPVVSDQLRPSTLIAIPFTRVSTYGVGCLAAPDGESQPNDATHFSNIASYFGRINPTAHVNASSYAL